MTGVYKGVRSEASKSQLKIVTYGVRPFRRPSELHDSSALTNGAYAWLPLRMHGRSATGSSERPGRDSLAEATCIQAQFLPLRRAPPPLSEHALRFHAPDVPQRSADHVRVVAEAQSRRRPHNSNADSDEVADRSL